MARKIKNFLIRKAVYLRVVKLHLRNINYTELSNLQAIEFSFCFFVPFLRSASPYQLHLKHHR